jgi:hypothetical protein
MSLTKPVPVLANLSLNPALFDQLLLTQRHST